MKLFTLLLATASILSVSPIQAKVLEPLSVMKNQREQVVSLRKADRQARVAAVVKAVSEKKYLPGVQDLYIYEDGEWMLIESYSFTYNPDGKIASVICDEDGYLSRTTYTYDSYGNCVLELSEYSEDGGEVWENSSKKVRAYDDPVVHSLCTANDYFMYDSGQWYQSMGNQFDVTRNADGNVTNFDIKVLFQGIYDPTQKIAISYPESGASSPDTWVSSSLTYDYDTNAYSWVEGESLHDIVWDRCDGQLVTYDYNNFFIGANRIKSASLYDDGEYYADINVEYPGGDDFKASISMEDEDYKAVSVHSLTYTDSFGSFVEKNETTVSMDGESYKEGDELVVVCDGHGNMVSETVNVDMDGESWIEGATVNEYTYDDMGRLIEAVTSIYDPDEDDYLFDQKIISSDFVEIDLSGISSPIASDGITCCYADGLLNISSNADAQVSICSVSGVSVMSGSGSGLFSIDVDSLAPGLYIAVVKTQSACHTLKFIK